MNKVMVNKAIEMVSRFKTSDDLSINNAIKLREFLGFGDVASVVVVGNEIGEEYVGEIEYDGRRYRRYAVVIVEGIVLDATSTTKKVLNLEEFISKASKNCGVGAHTLKLLRGGQVFDISDPMVTYESICNDWRDKYFWEMLSKDIRA